MQAIFLDRDGVINRERADYVKTWQEFEFLPGALTALRTLATLNLPLLVISNQSAIGRGLVRLDDVEQIHQKAMQQILAAGGRIDEFFICPHHPDAQCFCRKPKPGLLLDAARKYRLDLRQCLFIGDAVTDFEAAQAAGCQAILVESGRQGPHLYDRLGAEAQVRIVKDLSAAVAFIASKQNRTHG